VSHHQQQQQQPLSSFMSQGHIVCNFPYPRLVSFQTWKCQ
jgi:hypothetical protein